MESQGHRPIIVHIDCAKAHEKVLNERTEKIKSWWVQVFALLTEQSAAQVEAIVKVWRVRRPA